MKNPFHYAFKVSDLESTRQFYVDILQCQEGRSTQTWIDFELYGHQLSAHIGAQDAPLDYCGQVGDVSVPIPHFGCILTKEQFEALVDRLESCKVEYIIKPQTRYAGSVGEQQTLFILDFSGNPLEFKSFKNDKEIFAS